MATTNLSIYDKESLPDASKFRFAIVVSRWNESITTNLLLGAKETLKDLGTLDSNIEVYNVPGSFELVYASHKIAQSEKYDAIISIGSVIRGETAHFDYVCSAVAQGIKDINIQTKTPAVFCVLTDDTIEQSIARSGGKLGNKGVEAAVVAVEMAELKSQLLQ
ncbi:MAG: 6,7-dimethyl-8-ribityllumazine synthase [Flavobacteriales bacterium]|nr:6,7-dimethyl-8-ribityllumazine synthase [Flavobacteriales bacterium]